MAGRRDIEAGSAYVRVYMKQTAVQRGIKDLQRRLKSLASSATSVGRSLFMGAAAIAAPIAIATRTYAAFEDQMLTVKAVTSAVGAEFDLLNEKAKELGRTTSYTAGQVAGGMISLGRAGFDPREIDASIDGILNLARATGTELPEAAEIAAGTLRAFSLDASEMGRVSDVLTATANNSSQTLTDLGDSMKYAAPIADEYGLSVEQTAKALGVMANMQIKGSMAGTGLRKIMGQMASPEVQKQLRGMGIEALDAAGELRPLGDVMLEVGKAMEKMTGAERITLAKTLFGDRAFGGALKLAKGGFDDLSDAIDNASGTAESTAATMDSGLGGAFRKMMSAVEGVQIAIGAALNTELRGWSEWITKVSGSVTTFVETHRAMVIGLTRTVGVALAVGVALMGLGIAANIASFAVGALGVTLTFIGTHPVAMAIMAITASVVALNIAMNRAGDVTLDLASKQQQQLDAGNKLREADLAQLDRLGQLADQQSRTSTEMDEAGSIISTLEGRYGSLGLTIDKTTGSITGMADAQGKLTAAMAAQAEADIKAAIFENQRNLKAIQEASNELNTPNAIGLHSTSADFRAGRNIDFDLERKRLLASTDAKLDQLESLRSRTEGGAEGLSGPDAAVPVAVAGESPAEQEAYLRRLAERLQKIKFDQIDDLEAREIAMIEAKYEKEREEAKRLGVDLAAGVTKRVEIAAVRKRFEEERTAERESSEREIQDEIARLEVITGKEGLEETLGLLDLDKKRDLRKATEAGIDPAMISEKYGLLEEEARQRAASTKQAGQQAGPSGTFSAYALAAMGGSGGAADRTAKATEDTVTFLRRMIGLTKDEIKLLRELGPNFT